MLTNENNERVRPFLRCLNIPDTEWLLLKSMSERDSRSLSSFIRMLIKKEWQKLERRREATQVG